MHNEGDVYVQFDGNILNADCGIQIMVNDAFV